MHNQSVKYHCRICGQVIADVRRQYLPGLADYDLLTCKNPACAMVDQTISQEVHMTGDLSKYVQPRKAVQS